jgi:N utilization substance protein A
VEEEEYANQDWAEGEWVTDEESGELVWKPAEGGEAMTVEDYAHAGAENDGAAEASADGETADGETADAADAEVEPGDQPSPVEEAAVTGDAPEPATEGGETA